MARDTLPAGPMLILANHSTLQFIRPSGEVAALREYPGSGRPIIDLDKAWLDPTYSKIPALGDIIPYQAKASSYEAGYVDFSGQFHRVTPGQSSYGKRKIYTGAVFIKDQLAVVVDYTHLVWAASGRPASGYPDLIGIGDSGYVGPACVADSVTQGTLCTGGGGVKVTLSNTRSKTFGKNVPPGPVIGVSHEGSAVVVSADNSLILVDRKTGNRQQVAPPTDYSPTSAVFSPDNSTIAFTASRDTTTALFTVATHGGADPAPVPNATPISGAYLRAWLD